MTKTRPPGAGRLGRARAAQQLKPPPGTPPRRADGDNVRLMATRDESDGLRIGEVLKRARTRSKLDIHTVEQRTKIRTKYLRALENEEWEVLPGHPYAKGFLRTYAQCLGLDGAALVDEYRRTVESSLGPGAPLQFAEPVLERRRRLDAPRRRWPVRLA